MCRLTLIFLDHLIDWNILTCTAAHAERHSDHEIEPGPEGCHCPSWQQACVNDAAVAADALEASSEQAGMCAKSHHGAAVRHKLLRVVAALYDMPRVWLGEWHLHRPHRFDSSCLLCVPVQTIDMASPCTLI